jgi:VIT1/CCC1 family predicted Fe2+/Mn2+ transporter
VLPLLPYSFGAHSLWVSAVVSVVALFLAGVAASRFTSRSWWFSGTRQLLFGVLAAAITYAVGSAFHATTG